MDAMNNNELTPEEIVQYMQEYKRRTWPPWWDVNLQGGSEGNVYYGGGYAGVNIPVTQRLTVSPWVSGGGAYGYVPTPWGRYNIRQFQQPDYGIQAQYTIPF